MKAYCLDTETTNKDNPEVIEFAYTEVFFSEGCLCFPEAPLTYRYGYNTAITNGAMATHHIIPEDLVGLYPFNFETDMPVCDYIIGHNVDFDWKALGEPPVRRIDTLALCRKFYPTVDHSLGAMMYHLFADARQNVRTFLRSAHSADTDVIACCSILAVICEKFGITSMEELYAASEDARVPSIMPFGKFKGEPVTRVDTGWRSWYARQSDPDPYILEAFHRYPYEG